MRFHLFSKTILLFFWLSRPRNSMIRRSPKSLGALVSLLALSIAAIFLAGCGSGARSVAAEDKPAAETAEPSAVPVSREADDLARFLAGLPGTPGSPYSALESNPAWQEHRRELDRAWAGAEKQILSGLREFQGRELNSAAVATAPVLYPFSGPDILTASLYFPHSPRYVMVALEPAGTLPAFSQIEKRTDLPQYLAAIRETVASELGRSFFITRQMDRQFRGQVTDGLLIPILQLLVRTNNRVLGYRYVRIDESGALVDRILGRQLPEHTANKGFELDYVSQSDNSRHKLFYFSANLANDHLGKNTGFETYLTTLNGSTVVLKATSYMTHRPEFSLIRETLLANAGAVLQDDSGIPYHYFRTNAWNVRLYGDYDRPYGSFRWLEQADLREAYKTSPPQPLPMHIGYGFQRIPSNLLFAVRTGSQQARR